MTTDHPRIATTAARAGEMTAETDSKLGGQTASETNGDSTATAVGPGVVVQAEVTSEWVDLAALERGVAANSCGATVAFGGVIRDHDGGRAVTSVEYVAHPTAADVIRRIAADVAAEQPEARLGVIHRVDSVLDIGDVALACAVATPHRGEAFDICRTLVERVKHELPVWKRQVLADGTEEWVNCP